MEALTAALSVMQVVVFALFNFFGFLVIERLLNGKKNKPITYAIFSVINGACSCILMNGQSLGVTYFVAFLIMVVEIILIFNAGAASVLYGAMAILINSMCLHGMVSATMAWIGSVPLAVLADSGTMRLLASVITSLLEVMIVIIMYYRAPLSSVSDAIKLPKQRGFMLLWMILCVVFMFGNSAVYSITYVCKEIYINELLFCLSLLMSCYFMLFNTSRMNRMFKISEQNRLLSTELDNQKQLQNAFLKDSVFFIEVNLSQNRILSGTEMYMKSIEKSNFEYSLWFQYLEPQVHPDDREYFASVVDRENLIKMAKAGIEPQPFLYRRGVVGNYRWVKMQIRFYVNPETGDIMGTGYSFDVDADITREKELLEKSKTDAFTGLLNKATVQSMIKEQVRHGTGALFLLDIDNFKQVNDTLGHEAGDQILKFVASTMQQTFSATSIVGRVGGDEFMSFCPYCSTVKDVSEKAEALLYSLADTENPARPPYEFTASVGVTLIGKLASDFTSAYRQADMALYDVKHSGKNSFSVYGLQQSLFDYA